MSDPQHWLDDLDDPQFLEELREDQPINLKYAYEHINREAQTRAMADQIEIARLRHCLRFMPTTTLVLATTTTPYPNSQPA